MTQPDFASVLFSQFLIFFIIQDSPMAIKQHIYLIFSPQLIKFSIFSMGLISTKQNKDGQEQLVF